MGLRLLDDGYHVYLFSYSGKGKDYRKGVILWTENKLQELAKAFKNGSVSMDDRQSIIFIDGTDAVSRMLLTGDERLKEKIFSMVKNKTAQFDSLTEFEKYYLFHASKLLKQVQDFCSQRHSFMVYYKRLFKRGQDNFTYDKWEKGLTIFRQS